MTSHFPEFLTVFAYPGILFGPLFVWYVLRFKLKMPKGKQILYSTISLIILLPWLAGAAYIGTTDFLRETFLFIPKIGIIFVPMIIGYIALQKSKTLQAIIDKTPQHWMMGVQFYRLLGIMFLILYAQRLMPGEFAIPSGVGDLIIGITAPFVAYFYYIGKSWSKNLAIIWNYVGIGDLAIAILTGFLTTPHPYHTLALEMPNDLLIQVPLVTVPLFAVPLSILLHIYSLRVLQKKKEPKLIK